MKQFLTAIIISGVFIVGCSSARQVTQAQTIYAQAIIDTLGKQEQLADTFLQRLQQDNEFVMAAYTESLAWGRHYNYTIAVRNHGAWQGYAYVISGTKANPTVKVNDIAIDAKAADASALLLNSAALWNGKDNHETCSMAVSDGSTSYLLAAAGGKVLRNKYYMPEVYQQNCPDSSRQFFIEAFGKVKELGSIK